MYWLPQSVALSMGRPNKRVKGRLCNYFLPQLQYIESPALVCGECGVGEWCVEGRRGTPQNR